jgi:hypothetical protein
VAVDTGRTIVMDGGALLPHCRSFMA